MKYLAGTFLRNKTQGNVCKLMWDQNFINEDIWELWEPNEGDWCWFCEEPENFPLDFVLDKFLRKDHIGNYKTFYNGASFEYCFPFLGELPK